MSIDRDYTHAVMLIHEYVSVIDYKDNVGLEGFTTKCFHLIRARGITNIIAPATTLVLYHTPFLVYTFGIDGEMLRVGVYWVCFSGLTNASGKMLFGVLRMWQHFFTTPSPHMVLYYFKLC